MTKIISKITKLSFYSLALIPLLKENYNSMCIIFFTLLVLYDIIRERKKVSFNRELLYTTGLFWLFLSYQIISIPYFDLKELLKYLPFIVLPFVFTHLPNCINFNQREKSIIVFQASVFIQCIIYTVVFLFDNNFSSLFDISNENIPYFRTYVLNNYFFKIHPTYFSTYLLISFTISLFRINSKTYLSFMNIIFTVFFILLFSSRVIIVAVILTLVGYFLLKIKKMTKKQLSITFLSVIIIGSAVLIPSKDIIFKRFYEAYSEINKPVKGSRHNSTNTRVAIIKCSIDLSKNLPLLGYGNSLQKELNKCYESKFDSNFQELGDFNTHNFYMHNLLYGGVVYFFFFLLFLIYIYKRIRDSELGLFIFIQFLMINLTENYLVRHYGIVTFMYIICLLIYTKPLQNRKKRYSTPS